MASSAISEFLESDSVKRPRDLLSELPIDLLYEQFERQQLEAQQLEDILKEAEEAVRIAYEQLRSGRQCDSCFV